MKWNNLSLTLKVRLISNFFQEIITTAFLPFMALYLSDMTSTKFAGIFNFIGFVKFFQYHSSRDI